MRPPLLLALLVPLVATVLRPLPARADAYLVFQDDEDAFLAALTMRGDSTVVDSGGAFAPDPAAAAGVASVTRTGTIGTDAFSFTVQDVNASAAPTGRLGVGQDVASTSTLAVERPVANGGATGTGSFGYDSQGSPDGSTTRNAMLVDFTTTPGGAGIGHFALELVDFEAGATPGELRLYDGGTLVFASPFAFAGPRYGDAENHFLGVVAVGAAASFDQVMLVIGDETTSPNSENWAADRMRFGLAHNPEPGTWALFGLGVLGLGFAVHRRRAAAAAAESGAADAPGGVAATAGGR
jgi:hypothetical protein